MTIRPTLAYGIPILVIILTIPTAEAQTTDALPMQVKGDEEPVEKSIAPIVSAGEARWSDGIRLGVQVEAGIAGNLKGGDASFGQLFTDHGGHLQFNQLMVTAGRAIGPASTGYDIGFDVQALFGSDGRYNTMLGINGDWMRGRNQLAIAQANVVAHLPWLSAGGLDLRAGIIPGQMGVEMLDPAKRPFYTLSYTTNFLLPVAHVGAIATWHVRPGLDLMAGVDGGNLVSLGAGDNNGAPAGYLGFALPQLADGKLSIYAMSRAGPEQPSATYPNADGQFRFWNDVTATYRASPKLTITLEGNYLYDEALKGGGFAVAGFATYASSPNLSFNLRAEGYRDETGYLTAFLVGNSSSIESIAGRPTTILSAPPTTYGSLTAGATISTEVDGGRTYAMIRPEIRYDRSLSGSRPFNEFRNQDAVYLGIDIIVGLRARTV